jgi:Ca2+-transporting ATPase
LNETWHAEQIEEALSSLGTSPDGINSQEAKERLAQYGPNKLVERGGISPLKIFLGQFKDVFVLMLLAAIVISLLITFFKAAAATIEDYADTITIGVIVALNAVVGFVQEYRSEKAIEAMKKLTAPKARVMRDGKETIIPAEQVVPGDILLLESGDRIAADARLLEAVDLKTDEAVLTGESTPVDKKTGVVAESTPVGDRKNMVFTATHITYGRGRAVVTATGMTTEFGKIAELVQTIEEEETPLKAKLSSFAKKLGILVVVACAVIFVLELIDPARPGEIIDSFFTAVALAVSAVPEGLPAVVTVSLALGARDLAKRNAIIRRLPSAETLGAVTVICSDKTGTLTKGEMTVREVYVGGEIVDVTGVGYEAEGEFHGGNSKINPKENQDLELLLRGGTLCTNASYDGKSIIGDTTEGALIVAAAKAGLMKKDLEKEYPRIHEVPFTSERKMMATVHERFEGSPLAFVKGAPEIVLSHCTRVLRKGKAQRLTEKDRNTILKLNGEMANQALRVLGVAYKEMSNADPESFSEDGVDKKIESQLIFMGLVGMIDPPREEAKSANNLCRQAGIKTAMITGDHQLTAVAVAKEIGMIGKGDIALTGEELDKLSDEEFDKVVKNVAVYARVSPEHKLRIVRALKRKGEIVAMTGDGVNDAPALKQSDIGVAMGITGTDVTKEAADMVLADDNFATIVSAVEGGRSIYDNIRKFSFFLMRCNFDELFIIGTFALMGMEIPLTAGMILWLNLVTDGGPALALTMDPPEKDIMKRPPRNPNEGVLYGRLASMITTFTLQFVLTGGIFYWQFYLIPPFGLQPGTLAYDTKLAQARTMAFIRATLQELFVVWNCRSEKHNAFKVGFTSNRFLLIAVVISSVLTVLVPFTGLFGTIWLDEPFEWAITIGASLSGLLILPEVFYGRKIWRWT